MRHGSTTPPVHHTHARPSADGMQERTKQGSGSQKRAPDSKCPSGSEPRSVLASLSRRPQTPHLRLLNK